MRFGVWVQLGLMAFVGGSLLRLGVQTGVALFTMFGMITFVLLGLRALAEVSTVQSQAGLRDLERILRREAGRWPVLRLPGRRPGAPRYLVHAGGGWVALGADTSSDAGFWWLVRPGLIAHARRLQREAASLPLGEGARPLTPVLVLVRRRVRPREEALGKALGVRLLNAEVLPGLLEALSDGAGGASGEEAEGGVPTRPGIQVVGELARRLGARVLSAEGAGVERLAAGS